MGHTIDMLLPAAKRIRGYAEKLTQGIADPAARRKPMGANAQAIDTNHPLFVYGHLGVYPSRVIELTGGDAAQVKASEAWVTLFKAGAPCVDDREGTIYPSWDDVRAHFFRATDAAIEHLARVDDALLFAHTPDPKTRESFPTVGALATFLLSAHPMVHLGQVSAWRRCMGMPGVL